MAIGKPKRRKPSNIKRTDPKQSARFVAAAKKLGLEGSVSPFERAMKVLSKRKKPKDN